MEVAEGVFARREDGSVLWTALSGAVLPSLRVETAGECSPVAVTTRLGGLPLVEPGFVWPRTVAGRPLSLIGQLNCDEVNIASGCDVLPAGVLLAFFFEAVEQSGWGFDPADDQHWRVVRINAAAAGPAQVPDGAVSFSSRAVVLRRVLTVPNVREPPVHAMWVADRAGVNAVYKDLRLLSAELDQEFSAGDRPGHRVFGWPDLMQNPMQLDCQLASHGIYIGGLDGRHGPRVEDLRSGAADWMLLLQIDTDRDLGWSWGDAGTIYYWIRRQDLAAGEFGRTWMMLQSG
jgi:uncharacterized protein YwqG